MSDLIKVFPKCHSLWTNILLRTPIKVVGLHKKAGVTEQTNIIFSQKKQDKSNKNERICILL